MENNQIKKRSLVVWKDGSYKVIIGETWEYENDPDFLVVILIKDLL